MRVNKKFFWISVIILVASIILITLAHILEITVGSLSDFFGILKNVFISLFGGAFLSAAFALLQFKNKEKDYKAKFFVYFNQSLDIISKLSNWYDSKEDKIDYSKEDFKKAKTSNLTEDNLLSLHKEMQIQFDKFNVSNRLVQEFYGLAERVRVDFEAICLIIEDFCGLVLKQNSAQNLMKKMLAKLQEYDILIMDKEGCSKAYESGIWNEEMLHLKLVPLFREKLKGQDIKDNSGKLLAKESKGLKELQALKREFSEIAKIGQNTN